MRIHITVSAMVILLSLFFDLNTEKYLILFLTMALVMVSEAINSSVECLVDIYSKNYSSTAKVAKDIAAGAVMIAAGFAVIIGIFMFSDFHAYVKMWDFFYSYPFSLLLLILFIISAYLYIFRGPVEIKNKLKKFIHKTGR